MFTISNWFKIGNGRSEKISHTKNYKIGKDIGIISYNDTPVKEVLEGGITVICTDFRHMEKKRLN